MRVKSLVVFAVFLAIVLVNLNNVNALTYDCQFRELSTCVGAWDNILLKVSHTTNAHAELRNQTSYTHGVCCNYGDSSSYTCTGTNEVIGLAAKNNSHVEVPSLANYGWQVCYENLTCIHTQEGCNSDYPIKIASLYSNTNSHLENNTISGTYPIDICCQNSLEPVNPCQDIICNPGPPTPLCVGGDFIPADDTQYCCDGTSCCYPNFGSEICTGKVCGSYTNSCGQVFVCGGDTRTCSVDYGTCSVGGTESCDLGTGQWDGMCTGTIDPSDCGARECGLDPICGNLDCGSCLGAETCDASGQCVEPLPSCTLNNIRWNSGTAVEGTNTQFTLSVTDCNGQNIEFEVWEYDTGLAADDQASSPASIVVSGTGTQAVVGTWTAQWMDDDDIIENNPPEYYIKAKYSNQENSSEDSTTPFRYMNVTKSTTGGSCTGIVSCGDYPDQTSCTSNNCSVQNGALCNVCDGVDDLTYDTNCRCQWNSTASACQDAYTTLTCPFNQTAQCNNNGIREAGEACDGLDLSDENGNNLTCEDFGYGPGSLSCVNCNYVFTGCGGFACNNDGIVDFGNETCDGTNFTKPDGSVWLCTDTELDNFNGGTLACTSNCALDTDGCNFYSGGGDEFAIGTCAYSSVPISTCDEPPEGIYIANWTGTWAWGHTGYPTNTSCENENGVGCILDGGLWYYDPEGKSAVCRLGGTNNLECPAEIRLPFFGSLQVIITLLVIASIYGMIALDRRKR